MKERIRQGQLYYFDNFAGFILEARNNEATHGCPPQTVSRLGHHAEVGSRSWRYNAITPFIETT
jgi:hypothetical protein